MSVNDDLLLYRDGPAPDTLLRWLDAYGDPVDCSVMSLWRAELVDDDNVAQLTKTSNITGTDGEATVANAVIRWVAAELAEVPAGDYRLRLSAVETDGRRRYFPGPAPHVRVADAAGSPP